MHELEPFYAWRDYYIASEDKRSPFYGTQHSPFFFTNKIYNYLIHPQWDNFGSSTLYCKLLYVDYNQQFAVIELIGEWNDALHNDIMELKTAIADKLARHGVCRYMLIGENVLNFHASDDLYYEEWYQEVMEEGGWIAAVNFRPHVIEEMQQARIHNYVELGAPFDDMQWRKVKPFHLCDVIETMILKRLG